MLIIINDKKYYRWVIRNCIMHQILHFYVGVTGRIHRIIYWQMQETCLKIKKLYVWYYKNEMNSFAMKQLKKIFAKIF